MKRRDDSAVVPNILLSQFSLINLASGNSVGGGRTSILISFVLESHPGINLINVPIDL